MSIICLFHRLFNFNNTSANQLIDWSNYSNDNTYTSLYFVQNVYFGYPNLSRYYYQPCTSAYTHLNIFPSSTDLRLHNIILTSERTSVVVTFRKEFTFFVIFSNNYHLRLQISCNDNDFMLIDVMERTILVSTPVFFRANDV